jgi:predicted proteasome-type protease
VTNWSDEETDNPDYADQRNFCKVEKWSRDGQRVIELLFAGSNLATAQAIFAAATKHRPRIRLTIRQRTRVLREWPLR